MLRKFSLMSLFVLALTACAGNLCAQTIWEAAESCDYKTKAWGMLARGVTNFVISPAEIPTHIYKKSQEGKPYASTLQGLGEGVIWTVDRAGRGVWDVLTFWCPNYNGEPPDRKLSWC